MNKKLLYLADLQKEDSQKKMFKQSFISEDVKGVSKQIRKRFSQVIQTMELDLRVQNSNRQQNLQKMYNELKKMSQQINRFSNLLLDDNFSFMSLEQHPLVIIRYCEIMFSILVNKLTEESQKKAISETIKSYNQNNIYEFVASVRLQNFDLKEKVKSLQNQLLLSKQRAELADQITMTVKTQTEDYLKTYQENLTIVCDLLKKAENTQIELLQTNRFLKQQLQSLSIQFERYKEYFKLGPSLQEKEFRMKNQLQKEYEAKIKSAIKQVETCIKRQLERSVVEKFHLKDIKNLRIF